MGEEKVYWRNGAGAQKAFLHAEQEEVGARTERIAAKVFSVDGHSGRDLMPYPHEPWRAPALWTKYDSLSVADRLATITDESEEDKAYFEALVSTFGSAPASQTGFTEALRWYALGGFSMEKTFELAGVFKLGKGGMTSLARAILDEYRGDLIANTEVRKIHQTTSKIELWTTNNIKISAKRIVSTIPL